MDFTQDELVKIQKLVVTYEKAKGLILYSEEIDPTFNSNIQPIKELRDAFDHIMQVLAYKYGNVGGSNGNLVIDNLEKALGHAYRAAFDALDGSVMSLKESIAAELQKYTVDAISTVLPSYWDMKRQIVGIASRVGLARGKKDISENIGKVFDEYLLDLETLKGIYDTILANGEALAEYTSNLEQRERRKDRKDFTIQLTVGAILVVFGFLLGRFF